MYFVLLLHGSDAADLADWIVLLECLQVITLLSHAHHQVQDEGQEGCHQEKTMKDTEADHDKDHLEEDDESLGGSIEQRTKSASVLQGSSVMFLMKAWAWLTVLKSCSQDLLRWGLMQFDFSRLSIKLSILSKVPGSV